MSTVSKLSIKIQAQTFSKEQEISIQFDKKIILPCLLK